MLAGPRRRDDAGSSSGRSSPARLPQPGAPRQAGRHDRRDLRRPVRPRPRRRLERDRVPGVRVPVRPPDRPVRGGVHDHPDAAPRRRDRLRRALLPGPRLRVAAARPRPGGPPLLIGSNGRADAADHGAPRRRLELLVRRHRQHARRASPASATVSTPRARDAGRDPGRDRADGRRPGPDAGRHRPDDGRQRREPGRRAARGLAGGDGRGAPGLRRGRGSATSSSSSTRSTAPSIEAIRTGPRRARSRLSRPHGSRRTRYFRQGPNRAKPVLASRRPCDIRITASGGRSRRDADRAVVGCRRLRQLRAAQRRRRSAGAPTPGDHARIPTSPSPRPPTDLHGDPPRQAAAHGRTTPRSGDPAPISSRSTPRSDWPLIITEYRSRRRCATTIDVGSGGRPGQGEPPYTFVGLNILIEFGPVTGARPTRTPTARRSGQASSRSSTRSSGRSSSTRSPDPDA